jgi:UDP-N-acetylmuramate--alanine ligase
MQFDRIKYVYFLGIGGIGMSALARFFLKRGMIVGGYDRKESALTKELVVEGADLIYEDNVSSLSPIFKNASVADLLVVYTPAVPEDSGLLCFFRNKKYDVLKRAEVLGVISEGMFTVGIAGTHGKTTTSTMLTHIMVDNGFTATAFLGGISGNYGSNYIDISTDRHLPATKGKNLLIVEADEYDRSFLQLNPSAAILTSADADHLDIYSGQAAVYESYQAYLNLVENQGPILLKKGLDQIFDVVNPSRVYTYSITEPADFVSKDIRYEGRFQFFQCYFRGNSLGQFCLSMPGKHNVENALAVIGLCHVMNLNVSDLLKALESFKGVKRRFEICYEKEGRVIIDDYAHHPEEIRAAVQSARHMFPGRKITGVFQPHLYSRTRDFAQEFAESLDLLDRVLFMEIYPARELPIDGVNSMMIAQKLHAASYEICERSYFKDFVSEWESSEVVLVMGAGDIENIVPDLVASLKSYQ